ncbi:MAG: M13 family peptidase, partial [Alloprevotella sp.]|nr:M13 family peptidase [Alloprevotella sp.]
MKKNLLLGLSLFAATASAQGLSSGLNLDNLDRSYRPGDDFYQFATAGWQRANPLTAEYSRYGAFNVLHENNQKQLRALIEELANTQQAPGTIGQKIGSLYRL